MILKQGKLRKFSKYKIQRLNLETLVLALYCYCRENIKYELRSKHLFKWTHAKWKASESNNKHFWNIISSSYYMNKNLFNEKSYINNIHTGEEVSSSCWDFSDKIKNIVCSFICLPYISEEQRANKHCLSWVSLIFFRRFFDWWTKK